LKAVVELHAHVVDIAATGAARPAAHADEPYDVLAVDYQLPDMTGIDVCRKLLLDNLDLPIFKVTEAEMRVDNEDGQPSRNKCATKRQYLYFFSVSLW
jgi:DNA-binding response OmpR family regulator